MKKLLGFLHVIEKVQYLKLTLKKRKNFFGDLGRTELPWLSSI